MQVYMIAIEGNELSQYYADICINRWNDFEIYPEIFPASTPGNTTGELKFAEKKWNGNSFSEIEKAIWDSHYRVWKQIAANDTEGAFVIEHDTYPTRPITDPRQKEMMLFASFPRNDDAWFKGEERVAPGAGYYLTNSAAKTIINNSIGEQNENVDGFIMKQFVDFSGLEGNSIALEAAVKDWLCAFQIVNYDLGTTAEHNGKVGK
jgi:GR25 family glycosyltransferase involved in LPS biosynthesis